MKISVWKQAGPWGAHRLIAEILQRGGRRLLILRAFTVVELLVVIAVVALLAATALQLPREDRGKTRVTRCMSNCKQLATGYLMYAVDHHDIALAGAANSNGAPAWVAGNAAVLPDAVDPGLIRNSPLFHYLGKPEVFRCPADRSAFSPQGQLIPRNRSYSLNAFVGPDVDPAIRRNGDKLNLATKVSIMNPIRTPGPSAVFLFVDEHENSIDDGQFLAFGDWRRYGDQEWLNCPAGRHNNAAGFAFADGHSEIHKWQDSVVTAVELGPPPKHGAFPKRAGPADFTWLANHVAVFNKTPSPSVVR
jgi:prepilin-type processing-associated H-X9-DG protein/prepilin-type N-terminal cleavage/methylation domain-containing protein